MPKLSRNSRVKAVTYFVSAFIVTQIVVRQIWLPLREVVSSEGLYSSGEVHLFPITIAPHQASLGSLTSSPHQIKRPVPLDKGSTDKLNNVTLKNKRVLLFSYIFGSESVQKRYLRLFVESARWCGVDVVLVGDHTLPFSLPPNVRHHRISWDEFTDRVRDKVLDGQEPYLLRHTQTYYKVIDFKPLFAFLFPEEVDGYDWWGHVDNDSILGDLRGFLRRRNVLLEYDVISGISNEYTWGPITLFRNTVVINTLFKHSQRPLAEIFATNETQVFDEWGGGSGRDQSRNYESTMAGLIDHHRRSLGIRWMGGMNAVWDGFCRNMTNVPGVCSECIWSHRGMVQNCFGQTPCHPRVVLCHFEFSKATIEKSLIDDSVLDQLVAEGRFRINFLHGVVRMSTS